jgi:hypothetical protein
MKRISVLRSSFPVLLRGGLLVAILCGLYACTPAESPQFVRVSGHDLLAPSGEKLLIRGTNLGNWLNPEGYMFGFNKANSARLINDMLCQLTGPDFAVRFWREFKDSYITRDDIRFIASTGSNTIRLPFHYKLFTDEDYMGLTAAQDGFARIDSAVQWCRSEGLYLILDMHDAPGGQTGDNIDDSYGYPWLFESEESQKLYCDIWRRIAAHYKDEPVILGYELLNEPIAPYFGDTVRILNSRLEDVYKLGTAAIREVDANHIILWGGAQWNGNFRPLTAAAPADPQIMYTCHRYGGAPKPEAIAHFIHFRDSVNRPMYMGEIGHNRNEWMSEFCRTMEANNIGWTFWPYKKVHGSSFVGVVPPDGWDAVTAFAEAPRTIYKEIRDARPGMDAARQALLNFIEACRFENSVIHCDYIEALGLRAGS